MSLPTPSADTLFSDQWLALREPNDHLARDAQLTHAADCWLTRRTDPHQPLGTPQTIVDLGCGSGSNLRYLAPRLHGAQHWRLVDHDAELLVSARLRCQHLTSLDAQPIHLESVNLSLAEAWEQALNDAVLVTASALFDLLTPPDIDALAQACHVNGCAALFALSVDGRIRFHGTGGDPVVNDDDRFAFSALEAHQRRDKGSGHALGTQAPRYLRERFHQLGYHIREATTPWRLGPESLALTEALLSGWRSALHEQLPGQTARIDRWHGQRLDSLMSGRLTLTIGHRDLLVTPPAPTGVPA